MSRVPPHPLAALVPLRCCSRGSLYGLVGPNGAGKTTLLSLLAATGEPTAAR